MTSPSLEQTICRFRARARRILFVRAALTAIVLALPLTVLWSVTRSGGGTDVWLSVAVGLAGALTGALLVTYRRTPTLGATAATIDTRLRLQNHIGAALGVANENGAMASLVVRSAQQRLRDVTPAQVFPLDAGRQAVAAAAVILVAALALTAWDGWRSTEPLTSDGSAPTRAGRMLPGVGPARGSTGTANSAKAAFQAQTGVASAPLKAALTASDTTDVAGTPTPSTGIEKTSSSDPVASAIGSGGLANAREPRVAARIAATPKFATPGGEAGTRSDASSGNFARDVAGRTASGAGGQVQSLGNTGIGAGGVSSGSVRDRGFPLGAAPTTSAVPVLPNPAAARAQADAALTDDDIRPSFRSYVRDYFLRLQATRGQQ